MTPKLWPLVFLAAGCWVVSDRDLEQHDRGLDQPSTTPPAPTGPAPLDTGRDGKEVPPASVACGDVTFTEGASVPTGAAPAGLGVGDLDGDGDADLAVSDAEGTVAISLGNGDGTFATAIEIVLPSLGVVPCPGALAVGALGSGRFDEVAVVDSCTGVVWIVRLGDEGFVGELQLPGSSVPTTVAVAPIDANDTPDVAVPDGANVEVLLRSADGTFTPGTPIEVGGAPSSLAAEDLDGDGLADLAVLDADAARVAVWRGEEGGTFAPDGGVDTAPKSLAVRLADLDADGLPDLAVAAEDAIGVFLNLGPDGWSEGSIPAAGLADLVVGDFLGTGCTSLATADGERATVSWLRGLGDGTFDPPEPVQLGTGPTALVTAQLDAVASPLDLLVLTPDDGEVRVLLGRRP